jgi:acetyltransferase-like isoleucine patch superfamily enzyme
MFFVFFFSSFLIVVVFFVGYRVELSEIESVMLEVGAEDVESAVVDVRGDKLIGFVLLRKEDDNDNNSNVDQRLNELRKKMTTLLAAYMVPAVIYAVEDIPKLTSGKVIRSQLKVPMAAVANDISATTMPAGEPMAMITNSPPADTSPNTGTLSESTSAFKESNVVYTKEQQMIVEVFEQQLGLGTVKSLDDSFFHLGGHSLLVSRAVTSLRERCPTISARDFYESKGVVNTLAAIVVKRIEIGSRIDTKRKLEEMARLHDVRRKPRTCLQLCCADTMQTLTFWFLALMGLAHTYGVIALIVFIYAEANFGMMVAWFVGLYYGLVLYSLLLAFLCKWLLIGKYKTGVYPLWGCYHLRWWFVRQLLRVSAALMFKQTCFAPLIYRCMGAKVGKRVFLGSSSYVTSEFDLIEVGDDATINEEAELKCHQVKDRVLILKQIVVGNSVTVSARSIVSGGAVLGDQVFLEPFTLVPEDFTVPAGEHWGGSPAVKLTHWSEDAHTLAPVISDMAEVAEIAEEVVAAAEKENEPPQVEIKTDERRPVDSVDSSVVNVGTPRRSHVVPEGAVYASTSRRSLFPCGTTCWQIIITLFGTLLSIAIYLPSLAMVVGIILETTPNSIQEYKECRATFYCARDMVCVPLPSIDDEGALQVSQNRFCIQQNNLEVLFYNTTAVLEINDAILKCRPVDTRQTCDFPFEHEGGIYTSCTLDPTPNMTLETTSWCKTTDGQWSLCQEPCHAGDIEIEGPEVFVEDNYNSYTGLSYSAILGTIVAANFSSLIIAWSVVAVMIRTLRSCENKCIQQENQKRGDEEAENMPYSISSWRFIAKWWMGSLLNTAGAMAQPLQGTMMMPFWLRMMGAKVGANVEFSSTKGVALDTLTLGDGTFVADSVMCGMPSVDQGTMRSRPVYICARAFVGNGAYVREGSVLGEDSLIALQTAAPRMVKNNRTFLGSPPLSIEKREKALGDSHLTYNPSCCRKCARLSFEVFGYLLYHLYLALFATTSLFVFDFLYGSFGEKNPGLFIFAMPIVQLLMSGVLCLLIVMSKWIIMCGRFKAGIYPLFSLYVWRTELVERLEENLAEPLLLNMLDGTCWKVMYYRCMGARIGRRPYLGHCIITEPDMISIGNDCTIESGGTLQAHLFQDRMRVVKPVALGASVSVGANSVVLLGGRLHNNVNLNPLSLSMRDEELPPRTEWYGSPATRVW